MISLDSILYQNPNVVSRVVENEAVLIIPEQGEVKVLNEVGSRIWELVDGKRSIQDISSLICQEFDVDQGTAEHDTLKFISDIFDKGIIKISPE
jgi:hypothetical protein